MRSVLYLTFDLAGAMAPVAEAFYRTALASAHIDFPIVVATVAMVAYLRFDVIAFTAVDVRAVVSLHTLHRHERLVLQLSCCRRGLLLVVVHYLLHLGVLHADGVLALLHLSVSYQAAGTVVQIVLGLYVVGRYERHHCRHSCHRHLHHLLSLHLSIP